MNTLFRELAPISSAAWQEIEKEATRTLKTYLGARLVHYVVYAAGIPVIRTLAFGVGFAATLTIAGAVLGHL